MSGDVGQYNVFKWHNDVAYVCWCKLTIKLTIYLVINIFLHLLTLCACTVNCCAIHKKFCVCQVLWANIVYLNGIMM